MSEKMNQEIKAKWVERLREPGRIQGKNMLRSVHGAQCCLDVLCEIAVENNVLPAPVFYEHGGRYEYEDADGEFQSDVLPASVVDWAGLTDSDPHVSDGDKKYCLSVLNDNHGYTFPQLADIIEEQL